MTGSLLAALLLIAQPAPEEATEEPVAVEAEAETEVQVQTPPAPAAQPDANGNGNGNGAAAEPAVAEVATEAEQEAQEPQEEEICRRRLVPSERVGQRHRVVTICRTREEWARGRRR